MTRFTFISSRRRRIVLLGLAATPLVAGVLVGVLGGSVALGVALLVLGVAAPFAAKLWMNLELGVSANSSTSRAVATDLAAVQKAADETTERLDGLQRQLTTTLGDVNSALEALRDRYVSTETRLDNIDTAILATKDRFEEARDRFETGLKQERRRTNLALARHRSEFQGDHEVLLLLTPQRTGSTRMYDILRTHPCVQIDRSSDTWESLGFRGRRYPSALSDGSDTTFEVEVQPGVGASIETAPSFGRPASDTRWFLEKAHPEFFDFDPERFVTANRERLDASNSLRLVYVVRRPLDTMWSMAEYKRRDPRWYTWLDERDIPTFVDKSYTTLLSLAERAPGVIIDFDDPIIGGPLERLGADLGVLDAGSWIRGATDWINDRRDGAASARKFVGARDPKRDVDGPDGCWSDLGEVVDHAEACWHEILGFRPPAPE